MYKAIFDSEGNRIASYHTDIHTNIPSDAVEISDEEQSLYATNEYIRSADGRPIAKPMYIPTMEELREQKWTEIKSIRDAKERSPLPYLGKLLDFDSLSSERLTWLISSARTAITLDIPLEIEWTCYDNSVILLSANDIIGIPLAVAQRSNVLHVKARELKLLIDNATTIEEVDNVVWLEDI